MDPDVYDGFPVVQHWFKEHPATIVEAPPGAFAPWDSRPDPGAPQRPESASPAHRDLRRSPSRLAHLDIDTVLFEPVPSSGRGADELGADLTQVMPTTAQVG